MRRFLNRGEVLLVAAIPFLLALAFGRAAVSVSPVTVGYGASVPSSCPAGSPALFVLRGSTGLVSINACANGAYSQIWQAERFADAETPSGAVDGTNVGFTLAHVPNPVKSLQLVKDGVTLTNGSDYTLSGQTITMTKPTPAAGDSLLAWYRY